VRHLSRGELHAIVERLSSLSFQDRVDHLNLREDRADVILPAAIVYERLAVLAGTDTILVPGVGLKEGVLLDLVEDLVSHRSYEERHSREVEKGALEVGRRYDFDEPHARHVTRLALQLFDELHELHAMEEDDRRVLLAAGLLHDIGQYIAYQQHHKHSRYLILNSEPRGLSPREIGVVALVARYHRRAEPKDSHEGYADLGLKDRRRVDKLAALLRIADALDREHQQQVEDVLVEVEDDRVTLRLRGRGDILLEKWSVKKKGKLFERVFDRRLRVISEAAGQAEAE
jgi:exopolyphosphatase/guanosine-5'-triphosphate,3'-diphosphate pyrophosphatase